MLYSSYYHVLKCRQQWPSVFRSNDDNSDYDDDDDDNDFSK